MLYYICKQTKKVNSMSLFKAGINRQCNMQINKLNICVNQMLSFNKFFEYSRCIEMVNVGRSENDSEYLDENFCNAEQYLRTKATLLGILPYTTNESNLPKSFRPMHAYERDFTNLRLDKVSDRDKKKLDKQISEDFRKWAESQVIGYKSVLANNVYGVPRKGLWFK